MRQIRHSEIDMTQGSVVVQLIAFSIPLLLGEVFQQLYNTADTLIVGRFVSKQALAAVSATSNIVNILIGLFAGISTGATVDISNRFGAQDDTGLKRSVQTISYLPHFISTVVVAGMAISFCQPTGLINLLLGAFGVAPQSWLDMPSKFPMIYTIINVWKSFGFNSIL